ncbi:MAG: UMP kinase, partial [Desulfoplanes sp.]
MSEIHYPRILLKLSGEALAGEQGFGIDPEIVRSISQELADIAHMGVQLAIVIGGGN